MVHIPRLLVHHREGTFPVVERGHHGVPYALLVIACRLEPVYDKLYEVGFVSVKLGDPREVTDFTVNAHLGVSSPAQLLEELLVMSFAAFDQRGQQVAFASLVVLYDELHDLLVSVADHLLPGRGGVCP